MATFSKCQVKNKNTLVTTLASEGKEQNACTNLKAQEDPKPPLFHQTSAASLVMTWYLIKSG